MSISSVVFSISLFVFGVRDAIIVSSFAFVSSRWLISFWGLISSRCFISSGWFISSWWLFSPRSFLSTRWLVSSWGLISPRSFFIFFVFILSSRVICFWAVTSSGRFFVVARTFIILMPPLSTPLPLLLPHEPLFLRLLYSLLLCPPLNLLILLLLLLLNSLKFLCLFFQYLLLLRYLSLKLWTNTLLPLFKYRFLKTVTVSQLFTFG